VLDNRFIVRLKPGEAEDKAKLLGEKLKAALTPVPFLAGFWRVVFPFESNYLANLERINALVDADEVCSGEPDLLFELRNNGCLDYEEDWFKCQDFIGRQHIDDVWRMANPACGNSAITVATIDEGVNPSRHDDVNKSALQCFDLSQIIDPNSPGTSLQCDKDQHPSNFHGMHVYGIISALHNKIGVAGIASDTNHIAVHRNAIQTPESYTSMLKWVANVDNARPIDRATGSVIQVAAVQPAADIINCSHSLHIPAPAPILQGFADITLRGRAGAGCVIVYSAYEAGNPDHEVQGENFAAQSPYPIIVSNSADDAASHWDSGAASTGSEVYDGSALVGWRIDLCAFGGVYPQGSPPIRSYGAPTLWDKDQEQHNIYCRGQSDRGIYPLGATSSAAAMVSGVAALVLSANTTLKWNEVKAILLGTAQKIDPNCPVSSLGFWRKRTGAGWFPDFPPDVPPGVTRGLNYHSHWYGFGRLDAAAAVQAAKDNNIPPGGIYAPF
jgi:hypothetical protein